MKYCKKCVYPDTKPGLIFDKEDVCNACRNHERKNEVNWEEGKTSIKGRNIDKDIYEAVNHIPSKHLTRAQQDQIRSDASKIDSWENAPMVET